MFLTQDVDMFFVQFPPPPKIMPFMRSGKILYSRQVTDDNIISPMLIAFWILKNKNTHLEYVITVAFSLQ